MTLMETESPVVSAGEDDMRQYLSEIRRFPRLTAQEERDLARRCAEGDQEAIRRMVSSNLRLVVSVAREYAGRGVPLLDLIQEGSLGLWQAISSFREGDFEECSDWYIRQSMAKAVTMQARNNGVGQKMRQAMEDYRAVDERLLAELGRNATVEEIAVELHMTPEETAIVKDMLDNARLVSQAKSAAAPKEEEPEDAQHVEDTALFQARQRIMDLLSGLSEADAKLLTLRFGLEGGLPMSPEETGRKLGLTPEEVISREAAALSILRNR